MTVVFALLIIMAVAGLVVAPLLRPAEIELEATAAGGELWHREKAVALLAISEADFDRATGKLSDQDYRELRDDYETRAIHAMGELEAIVPVETAVAGDGSSASIRFCSACGRGFGAEDRFCAGCGRPRA